MSEWISVKESLPDDVYGMRCIVYVGCSHFAHNCLAYNYPNPCRSVNTAYYNGDGRWEYDGKNKIEGDIFVTHWMPLPEPPGASDE